MSTAANTVRVLVIDDSNTIRRSAEIFLKQAGANTVEHIPVAGVPAGATVNLRAVTVDGTRTYTKNNVTLSSMTDWRLP